MKPLNRFAHTALLFFATSASTYALDQEEIAGFRVAKIDMHFIQSQSNKGYLTPVRQQFVVQKTLEQLLPPNASPDKSVDLSIYVNIYRSNPAGGVSYTIEGTHGDELVLDYHSDRLRGWYSSDCAARDDYIKAECVDPSLFLGIHLADQLSKLTSGFDVKSKVTDSWFQAMQDQLIKQLNEQPLYVRKQYIPDEVIEAFLVNMESTNLSIRLRNYEHIRSEWMDSPKLNEAIQRKIEQLLPSATTDKNSRELRYAMNALASFGDDSVAGVFEKISTTSTIPEEVQAQVKESLAMLSTRRHLVTRVHNAATFLPELDWLSNQLLNRLHLPTDEEVTSAMRAIAAKRRDNETLIDAIAALLQQDLRHESWRPSMNILMCKILARSGNKKYLGLLSQVQRTAKIESIVEHAQSAQENIQKTK